MLEGKFDNIPFAIFLSSGHVKVIASLSSYIPVNYINISATNCINIQGCCDPRKGEAVSRERNQGSDLGTCGKPLTQKERWPPLPAIQRVGPALREVPSRLVT